MVAYTDAQMREGMAYLQSVLPLAREQRSTYSHEIMSTVAKASLAHLREDNLRALIIYQVPTGWHADLVMKHTPPGVSDVLGTPQSQPCRDRETAETRAIQLVIMALNVGEQNATSTEKPPPAFILHDVSFELLPELYKALLELPIPREMLEYPNPEAACAGIEKVLDQNLPGSKYGIPDLRERFHDLPRKDQGRIMAVFHRAALSGVYRYPPEPTRTPTGHEDSTTKQ